MLDKFDSKFNILPDSIQIYPINKKIELDTFESLIFLNEGKITIYIENDLGKKHVVTILSAGKYFWGLAQISETVSNLKISVLETVKLSVFSKEKTIKLINQDFKYFIEINESMFNLFELIRSRVEEIIFLSASQRLAKFLYEKSQQEQVFSFTYDIRNYQQIADMLGVNKSTISRIISNMLKNKILIRHDNLLKISDPQKLLEYECSWHELKK